MKTKGVSKDRIEQFDYLIKDGYMMGVDSSRNQISVLEVNERSFADYAIILEPNMAEVLDGEVGVHLWYVKSWGMDNPISIGSFTEVNDDNEIIELVKKYIYNHKPTLYSSTLMGYKYENEYERIIKDPNFMTGYLIIGKEKYKVEKCKMGVTIQNEKKKLEFDLDENKYYQSVKRRDLFRELKELCGKSISFDERFELAENKLKEFDSLI